MSNVLPDKLAKPEIHKTPEEIEEDYFYQDMEYSEDPKGNT